MRYQKFSPAESLEPFVECYFVWEAEGLSGEERMFESPPSGFCSIVFNFGAPYYLQNKKYERLLVPQVFIAGQSIYSYKLFFPEAIHQAGIVLKPAALSTLFGLSGFEFTEERTDLFEALTRPYFREHAEKIKAADGPVAKVKAVENLLLHHCSVQRPTPDYIDTAANLILEKAGMLNVQDLLKDSCMSRRTFERHFFQKVGLSPKYFARVRRIGYICNLIAGKKKVAWSEVFYEAQFYDQAHFIKDFEEFTGRTPQQYLNENKELANLIAKPKTQPLG